MPMFFTNTVQLGKTLYSVGHCCEPHNIDLLQLQGCHKAVECNPALYFGGHWFESWPWACFPLVYWKMLA